ncbi:MAG: phage tail tube protein, partial [Candidatus Geothermarchaeales archaeon]
MATRYFGFAEETTFGTKAAIASYLDPIDVKIVSDTGKIFVETVQNRAAVKQVDGPFKCAGPISFYVEPENIAWFLKWALGSVSSLQGDTSGVYKHTFKPADTVKSWTGEEGAELFARVYTSCLIDKLTIDAVKKEALKGSIDIYAQKEEKEATLDTPSFSTLAPFVFHQGTITLNGVDESSEVEALSIALANN